MGSVERRIARRFTGARCFPWFRCLVVGAQALGTVRGPLGALVAFEIGSLRSSIQVDATSLSPRR